MSERPWWQTCDRLPDLPALLPGQRRRRHRRPAGHHSRGSTTSSGSASTRSGCRRSIPRRWPTSATTSPTICGIHPLFGTLDGLRRLRRGGARPRACKLILDFVPNHTSSEHPWFQEARASPRKAPSATGTSGATRPRTAGRPTTGRALPAGSAWEFDEATASTTTTPSCPSSRTSTGATRRSGQAMGDVLRFWLRRGVDGFRVDVIWHLMKDPDFRDDPPNPDYRRGATRRSSRSSRSTVPTTRTSTDVVWPRCAGSWRSSTATGC